MSHYYEKKALVIAAGINDEDYVTWQYSEFTDPIMTQAPEKEANNRRPNSSYAQRYGPGPFLVRAIKRGGNLVAHLKGKPPQSDFQAVLWRLRKVAPNWKPGAS